MNAEQRSILATATVLVGCVVVQKYLTRRLMRQLATVPVVKHDPVGAEYLRLHNAFFQSPDVLATNDYLNHYEFLFRQQ